MKVLFQNTYVAVLQTVIKNSSGVPIVVQWLTNPIGIREVAGLIPSLALWVKDPALP